MFRILAGMIIGGALVFAAMNPNDAKLAANKAVDSVHTSYTKGKKTLDEPEKPESAPTITPEMARALLEEIAARDKQK